MIKFTKKHIMAKNIIGDITEKFKTKNNALIVQQNNCTAVKHKNGSFSWRLKNSFPYSDPYGGRKCKGTYPNLAEENERPQLGSVGIQHCPRNVGPSIAYFFAQFKMGKANSKFYIDYPNTDSSYNYIAKNEDTKEHRLKYFKMCLDRLHELISTGDELSGINQIVFPKSIGCSSGGGDWRKYNSAIINFIEKISKENENIKVYIVKLPSQKKN